MRHDVRVQMSNVNIGAGTYKGDGSSRHGEHPDNSANINSSKP
jgi:hypothetical protein